MRICLILMMVTWFFIGAGQSKAGNDVKIVFSERIAERMDSINRVEQEYEARFRKNRHTDNNPARSSFRFNASTFSGTEWANERLIADVDSYTLENLLEALVYYNLERVDEADRRGDIRLTLKTFYTSNYNVAVFRGNNIYAKGQVELLDPQTGDVLESHKVSMNFINQPSLARHYQGDDLLFFTTDPALRVGPLMTQFVRKALSKIYPETKFAKALKVIEARPFVNVVQP